jgi:chemotaxis response regulator CheB
LERRRQTAAWQPRTEAELLQSQMEAIDAWNRVRAIREEAARVVAESRDLREDVQRRMEALRASHDAVMHRSRMILEGTASGGSVRAVVAHRGPTFRAAFIEQLEDHGIVPIATPLNGAEALGAVVAEQPDLLVVESRTALVSGVELVNEVYLFAPRTVVAAQGDDEEELERLLDAGAHLTFHRSTPVDSVVRQICALMAI